jgi:L-seryl-tRNA(Ser) seleniumtransferase
MTSMNTDLQERLRRLPGVDAVLAALAPDPLPASPKWVTVLVRRELEEAREFLRRGGGEGPFDPGAFGAPAMARQVRARFLELVSPSPETVINATGVLIHTNLGRSPLSGPAIARMVAVAGSYSDLEFDLEGGERGSRQEHVRELLGILTGAEDAMVVNNNAAAVLLALAATARGREVVISRGELVEIGGSFRIPEILEQSGARLREVGTTNRTHLRDFESAIGPGTGLLLRVHASNFRIEGFTAEVSLEELTALGKKAGIPVLVDLGSGALLDVTPAGVRPEPLVRDVVSAGPDLVTLSGDKLLGGPQAGIVLGTREAVGRLRGHPLARALRVDKLLLAALQATLAAYLDEEGARREVPVLSMLFEAPEAVRARAERLAEGLRAGLAEPALQVMVEDGTAVVGGGTLPLEGLRTSVVVLDPRPHTTAARLERAMRHVRPALLGRIQEDRVLLDLRTVTGTEEGSIPDLVREAWAAATGKGEKACSSRS